MDRYRSRADDPGPTGRKPVARARFMGREHRSPATPPQSPALHGFRYPEQREAIDVPNWGDIQSGNSPSVRATAYNSVRVRAVRPTAEYFPRTRSRYSFAVWGEIPILRPTAVIDSPEA